MVTVTFPEKPSVEVHGILTGSALVKGQQFAGTLKQSKLDPPAGMTNVVDGLKDPHAGG